MNECSDVTAGGVKQLTSERAIRSIVERLLLRTTIEALYCAAGADALGGKTPDFCVTCIRTALGRIRLRVPSSAANPLGKKLLIGKKSRLRSPPAAFLALPFCEEGEMASCLEIILGEAPSDNFVRSFGKILTTRLTENQTMNLSSSWSAVYLGCITLTSPQHISAKFELDYCIGLNQEEEFKVQAEEFKVLGLWDPRDNRPARWLSVREELQHRGLRKTQSLFTDHSEGLADAFLPLVSAAEDPPEMEPVPIRVPAGAVFNRKTILLTDVIPEIDEPGELLHTSQLHLSAQSARRTHKVSLPLTFAALLLLVLFGGFYDSLRHGLLSSLASASAFVPAIESRQAELTAVERRLLDDLKNPALSVEALAALIGISSTSENKLISDRLVELAEHPDALIRVAIAKAFAESSAADSAQRKNELFRLLVDPDFLVRGFAARSLASIGGDDAKEALLVRLLVEENAVVRSIIKRVLKG